ncbi:lipopolysaccharide biosynthesis protein [Georgenia satyanarayanai]|uniref:lipopolysaccharide biosynthesis protein n=1 Tax=Georgenia satyanarayanai TaxID=860221 RepID=UPI001263FCF7|nr:lipopolysaccharide biosynthesis protein [Georgenia satyanarayanai]
MRLLAHRTRAETTPSLDAWLDRSVRRDDLGHTVARGISWTLLSNWVAAGLQIATTVVLARLLTPADFGLMAMALTLTVIVTQFRQLGLSQAVVQRENLTWTQVNALFWVNAAAGVLLAVVVAAAGVPLAAFYGEPAVVSLCAALGAGFVFSGLAVQHGALLNRAMQFRRIAVRNMAAGVLSSAAAVAAALLGMGVWSLVVQNVSALVIATALNWWAVPWRPSRPSGLREALPLLTFGAHVSVANLCYTLSRQADNVIIGRVLDAGALGLYSRAYSLLMLPLRQLKTPVQAVMVPALASLQGEPERYRDAYRRAVSGLSHAGMPAVVVMAVTSHELVLVVLGEQWVGAAPLFQVLAVAGFVQLVSTTTGWIFTSTGRGAAYAGWAVVNGAVTIGGFAVGVRWGVTGVAVSYAVTQLLLLVPAFVVACRDTALSPADPFRAMARPVVVSTAVLLVSVTVRTSVDLPALGTLAVTCGAAGAVWVGCLAAWPRARGEVRELVAMARKRKARPSRTTASGGGSGA